MAASPSCAAAGDETVAEIASPGLHPPVGNDDCSIRAVHDNAAHLAAIDDAVLDGALWCGGAADGGDGGNDESDHRDRYANTVPMKFFAVAPRLTRMVRPSGHAGAGEVIVIYVGKPSRR